MPQSSALNVGINYGWDVGEDGWKAGVDFNWIALDTLVQPVALTVGGNTPPGSPAQGAAYAIGPSPTGAWSANADEIGVYYGSSWTFFEQREGWTIYDLTTGVRFRFNAGGWWPDPGRPINSQAGASYTAIATDGGRLVRMTSGSANDFLLPDDLALNFPIGAEIHVTRAGGGITSIGGATTDVILQSLGSNTDIAGQHGVAVCRKVAANTWLLSGDLV